MEFRQRDDHDGDITVIIGNEFEFAAKQNLINILPLYFFLNNFSIFSSFDFDELVLL